MMKKPRIVVADDHALVLEGFCRLLDSDFELLGTADNGRQLIDLAERLRPDVILLDISMPQLNGIEAARQISKALPRTKLVFLTVHSEPAYIAEAFRAGANGYVLKSSGPAELNACLREVLNGYSYVTPLVTQHVVTALLEQKPDPGGPALTPRQREVLQLVAEGRTAKEVAGLLNISVKTAEFHKSSIMGKLGLRTTADLVRYAIDHSIVGQ